MEHCESFYTGIPNNVAWENAGEIDFKWMKLRKKNNSLFYIIDISIKSTEFSYFFSLLIRNLLNDKNQVYLNE